MIDLSKVSAEDIRNFAIMAALLIFYVVLAVVFSLQKKTWPIAIYYIGCLVKDTGVLFLGWILTVK